MAKNMGKASFKNFQKLNICVGTVMEASVPKWSHWVMKLMVDIGKKKPITVFAGIMKFFEPDELIGKQYPFIVNLEPKEIGPEGDESQGMMLMVTPKDDEETSPILFDILKKVPNGTKVS